MLRIFYHNKKYVIIGCVMTVCLPIYYAPLRAEAMSFHHCVLSTKHKHHRQELLTLKKLKEGHLSVSVG